MADDQLKNPYTLHISSEEIKVAKEIAKKERKSITEYINGALASISRVTVNDRVVFYRLLATMLNAGMTITKSLRVLERQTQNPKMKAILGELSTAVEEGQNLSDGLMMFKEAFDEATIGMVSAGEASGKLNQVLLDIASQTEKNASIARKIKGAMIYPAAIFVVIVGVVIAVMTMVVPPMKELFDSLGSALPASTQMLITISDFLLALTFGIPNVFLVFVGMFGAMTLLNIFKRTPQGHYLWDKLMLKMPIFGMVFSKIALSRFCRFLGNLVTSGIPIVQALEIDANAVGNEVYRRRILLIMDDVKRGITIADNLKDDPLFPPILVSMIAVGEQTAQLDQIVKKIANFYDEEVDAVISNISKLMEPFILIVVAVLVGALAMAIMSPIMSLVDTFSANA
jgi:type IV pilus assembly protein PilC